jgi:TonB family protein
MVVSLLLTLSISGVTSVDEAIDLYMMGDIPGAITSLEELLAGSTLSLDEQLRAYDRLGSAYYAMGQLDEARGAYFDLLMLDSYYDLSPAANPRLRDLLSTVRLESMATALIQSDPPGAFVTLDDELLGVTPMLMDGLMGGNSYTIGVYAVGHEPESFVLTAEPGFHHEMTFQLASLTEPGGVAVAGNTGGGGSPLMPDTAVSLPIDPVNTAGVTGGIAGSTEIQPADVRPPDDLHPAGGTSGDVADAGAQQTGGAQPDAGTAVPGTTEELIAMLTAGGIDMASLASAGSLSSLETGNTGMAGSESASGGQVQSGVPLTADAGTQQVMVFSDVQSGSGTVTSGGSSYSSRSSDEILEVLNEKRSAIIFIYNKHLRTDPMLMGTVEIEMVIQPSGRVSDVRIIQSNTYNAAFELELARNIETWRFGSVDENEGPLTVQYPFSFSP